MAKKIKCLDCKFYVEPMECRRYPPAFDAEFPAVKSTDWCGEHKVKPVVKEETQQANREAAELIALFCEEFEDVFSAKPVIQGPDAQAAKNMIRDVGLEKSKYWVRKFLDLDTMPKWNRERGLTSLRFLPSAVNTMAAND